ncbi:DNA methyltransferase [Elstera cyanobacteriorum]|uniref:site-specific DNA-methyltransferase (adenine-specific) n=1 Tax=Elstera cyanobacteriorum TaxID=2022747 RepID=A0A255XTA2_9PROT|nr:type ISP restriction/modification enzyme [Elstera cyanobacteriorum]OYQ20198.1 DNA methyltransferase [Elstera cyanobacteriorum]GFZ81078.1 DNA methyltransferase [Elstera cyanobacteriorum]
MTLISDFIAKVQSIHKTGAATEHTYRPALETLLSGLEKGTTALNEPKRVKCGAPDFIVQRGEIVVGHVEAKDIGLDLRAMRDANKDQQQRYLKALPNLVYTNCLDWDFYRNGERFASVTIADYLMGIQPRPEEYVRLENLLREFIAQKPQSITSSRTLAEMMAGKAGLIKDVLFKVLRDDKELQTDLGGQYKAFREHLIHDIKIEDFADIYAETIAYGMFAARLHDTNLDTFTRQEALELLPKSNPFLRNLFSFVAGPNLDDSIRWIIDDLANVFQAANVAELMQDFGKLTGQNDPFLHFYETFLAAYNPAKRKARGVWYTPEPVVNFIVRAVDEVLLTEFGLADGLADTSKITINIDTKFNDAKGKAISEKREIHRVQILDPATGTGTFLAEVIKQIAPKVKGVAEGMWSGYIERDLIPRLHGFELLMASYAMCHMKLDMILGELGYRPSKAPPRLSVYLTNSLEEGEREVRDLFMAQWLTREAQEANIIKRDMPIMCVLGNPPYSGVSSNTGEWATNLIDPYKKEPGGKVKLKERNPKWVNDDYVKFIRFAEHMISKTGEGVLGFITNHGYIDSPTFRGMRWHLMQSFDKLYVLDLHGNSKKKEVAPDGSNDVNVFDIMQGVAVLIGVKHRKKSEAAKKLPGPAEVFHAEFWGARRQKYSRLQQSSLDSLSWTKLDPDPKYLMFYPINRKLLEAYDAGFELSQFMPMNQIGFQSHRDGFAVAFDKNVMKKRFADMLDERLSDDDLRRRYKLTDNRDWQVQTARSRAKADAGLEDRIVPCDYRPFDRRFCMLDETAMDYPRWTLLKNALFADNFGLNFVRQTKSPAWQHGVVSKFPTPAVYVEIKDGSSFAPLYVREDIDQTRRVNFDAKLWKKLRKLATHPSHGEPDELATFDYIYGVLHCPDYRKTFAEFLKIDFPRIPWPASPTEFWDVAEKGRQLRRLHLMEPVAIGETPYPFQGEGDGIITEPAFKDSKVWINETQHFADVPKIAWDAVIGGYQPAQKWLKDRRGRALSFDDVKHYRQIIKILLETDRIMQTITLTLDVPA